MRRPVFHTLAFVALAIAAPGLAQDETTVPGSPAAPEAPAVPAPLDEAKPESEPLVPAPFVFDGPKYRRMRGLPGPPPGYVEPPKIPNYFHHLQKLVAEAEAKPLPEPRQPNEPLTAPREYVFDVIDGVKTKDLMRATREAVREARDGNYGRPQAEIERKVEANLRFILEFYPLVATDADAMNNLFYIMEDPRAEPVFRRILYSDAVPGRGNDSLFTLFWRKRLAEEEERLTKMYGVSITTPEDDPVIRGLACENLYAIRHAELTALINKDANAKAFADTQGRPATPRDLKDPAQFALAPTSMTQFKKQLETLATLAELIAGLTAPTSSAPQSLRDTAIALLQRMDAELPFADPAFVSGLIAAAAPASEVPGAAPAAAPSDEEALAF